ncbi:MAG: 3-deoxy-manno-octulosonate cytidylyltransferase [Ignavibacteriales bacterium]|nr:3-deoxy-manno-octulosonate cytidylyltransferase [Ignavibacteriales bacterium]
MINPNIVAIIPARYASTRLPAKPLIDLCGKPMIQRVYEQVKQSSLIKRVIVATDHTDIASVVSKFGEVIMTPTYLKSGSDRIAYVAKDLKDADIIVNVQGDEPLIPPKILDEAIRPLLSDSSINVGTVVKPITSSEELFNPSVVKAVLDNKNFGLYFSRSPIPYFRGATESKEWQLSHIYYKHLGIYVFRRDFLLQYSNWNETPYEKAEQLEQLRILENGFKIKATITELDSIAVDTPSDADRVRAILENKKGSK